MRLSGLSQGRATARDLCIFECPTLWRYYPCLPVVRRLPGGQERECGVLYDARGVSSTYGYACTVFIANLFALPTTEAALFARRKYVYDTFEELAEDGWVVD